MQNSILKNWDEIDEHIITMEIEKQGETKVTCESIHRNVHTRGFQRKGRQKLKVLKYGEGKVKNNAERLIELCETFGLKIMNEFFSISSNQKTESSKQMI